MDARTWRNVALSLAVSAGFLYLAFRNVSLAELMAALERVRVSWLLVAVGVSFVLMAFRAWRWQLELRPLEHVPFARLWAVTAVAYMAINLFPARLGEVVRPGCCRVARRCHSPTSSATSWSRRRSTR
jgi:uncharacterized membrane protein YbhN (UPF0104 family)